MKGWASMIDTRKRRTAVFLFFLLMLLAVLLFCRQAEKPMCMDVPILTEAEQAQLGRLADRDLSWDLLYNGQRAAVDLPSSTVYIAQDIRKDTKAETLLGSLRTASASLRLSFAPDEAFGDLAAAVEKGHAFTLNVEYGSDKYTQYQVVFTTLPVLRIDGEAIGKNEKGKDICQGEMCLWTPLDPESGRYSVKNSPAQWHVRGGWSSTLKKTPFKLDLQKASGANRNLSLVGLGADDDWILNPMNLDDTKLKEKLFGTLWNQRAEEAPWNEKMSVGEYVEVVINGEYWGLFQLQRRVDGKLLQLNTEDILLKSIGTLNPTTPQDGYEIIASGLSAEQTYGLVEDFFYGTDGELLNMDNFLDVNLFLQCASAVDNKIKNIFFLLQKEEEGYQMSLLPWDTDMSWGTVWKAEAGGFAYDFEASRQNEALRIEYEWMQEFHPDLDRQMARRWFELREELLTLENMTEILEQEQLVLEASGAQQRDQDRWGLYYEGEDSTENLYRILKERLTWLDEEYSGYLS